MRKKITMGTNELFVPSHLWSIVYTIPSLTSLAIIMDIQEKTYQKNMHLLFNTNRRIAPK